MAYMCRTDRKFVAETAKPSSYSQPDRSAALFRTSKLCRKRWANRRAAILTRSSLDTRREHNRTCDQQVHRRVLTLLFKLWLSSMASGVLIASIVPHIAEVLLQSREIWTTLAISNSSQNYHLPEPVFDSGSREDGLRARPHL